MNKMNDQLSGKTEFRKIGGSWFLKLTPNFTDHIGLPRPKKVEQQATIEAREQTEKGKHGPYLSIWNPSQQENEPSD